MSDLNKPYLEQRLLSLSTSNDWVGLLGLCIGFDNDSAAEHALGVLARLAVERPQLVRYSQCLSAIREGKGFTPDMGQGLATDGMTVREGYAAALLTGVSACKMLSRMEPAISRWPIKQIRMLIWHVDQMANAGVVLRMPDVAIRAHLASVSLLLRIRDTEQAFERFNRIAQLLNDTSMSKLPRMRVEWRARISLKLALAYLMTRRVSEAHLEVERASAWLNDGRYIVTPFESFVDHAEYYFLHIETLSALQLEPKLCVMEQTASQWVRTRAPNQPCTPPAVYRLLQSLLKRFADRRNVYQIRAILPLVTNTPWPSKEERLERGKAAGVMMEAYAALGETEKAVRYGEAALKVLLPLEFSRGIGADHISAFGRTSGKLNRIYLYTSRVGRAREVALGAMRAIRVLANAQNPRMIVALHAEAVNAGTLARQYGDHLGMLVLMLYAMALAVHTQDCRLDVFRHLIQSLEDGQRSVHDAQLKQRIHSDRVKVKRAFESLLTSQSREDEVAMNEGSNPTLKIQDHLIASLAIAHRACTLIGTADLIHVASDIRSALMAYRAARRKRLCYNTELVDTLGLFLAAIRMVEGQEDSTTLSVYLLLRRLGCSTHLSDDFTDESAINLVVTCMTKADASQKKRFYRELFRQLTPSLQQRVTYRPYLEVLLLDAAPSDLKPHREMLRTHVRTECRSVLDGIRREAMLAPLDQDKRYHTAAVRLAQLMRLAWLIEDTETLNILRAFLEASNETMLADVTQMQLAYSRLGPDEQSYLADRWDQMNEAQKNSEECVGRMLSFFHRDDEDVAEPEDVSLDETLDLIHVVIEYFRHRRMHDFSREAIHSLMSRSSDGGCRDWESIANSINVEQSKAQDVLVLHVHNYQSDTLLVLARNGKSTVIRSRALRNILPSACQAALLLATDNRHWDQAKRPKLERLALQGARRLIQIASGSPAWRTAKHVVVCGTAWDKLLPLRTAMEMSDTPGPRTYSTTKNLVGLWQARKPKQLTKGKALIFKAVDSNVCAGIETTAASRVACETFVMDGADDAIRLLSSLPNDVDHVHISSHFSFGVGVDVDPGLQFGAGQVLSIDDFLNREQKLTGVSFVLASCATNVATSSAISSGHSLPDALCAAGASWVLAANWPIDDLCAALTMERFYQGLARGWRPVAALRSAQVWVRNIKDGADLLKITNRSLQRCVDLSEETKEAVQFAAARRIAMTKGKVPFAHWLEWSAFSITGRGF